MKSKRPRKNRPAAPRAVVIVPVFILAGMAAPVGAGEILTSDRTLSGTLDGALGSGYLVQSGTLTINNATVTNFITQGGTGSGGGAGLGGAIFINSGAAAVLNSVTVAGNAAIGGTGGSGLLGGVLNGLMTSSANGSAGSNGSVFVDNVVLLGDGNGNGVGGGNAGNGTAASAGFGGSGGIGGHGSDGWSTNPKLIYEVTQATIAEAVAIAEVTAGAAEVPPNPAQATAAAAALVAATAALGEATAQLVAWELANSDGYVGLGGDGGAGGIAGAGSFGFGGGAGGSGGAGGDGTGGARDGLGGDGGTGGAGGFGGGGGRGGLGGAGAVIGSGGAGGAGGFGAGVGSNGSGNGASSVAGGGGGSGLGGAIFVRDGGSLTVTGNSTFGRNNVQAGGSLNGGAAGETAGSEIFMMRGSTVEFAAGAGNVITINGGIADDSSANVSFGGVPVGAGASVTISSGLTVFNGANTYTGQTIITGGALRAQDGVGLSANSNLNLAGGVLESSGVFDRFTGTYADRVQWTGSGGFAGVGDGLTVRLNAGAALTWGQDSFVSGSNALIFGSATGTADVTFENSINLAGTTRNIHLGHGTDVNTTLSGVLSNGGLTLTADNNGAQLILTGTNTYTGATTITGGTLALQGTGSIAQSSSVTIGTNGTLDISGTTAGASFVTLAGDGGLALGARTATVTNGSTTFGGVISGTGGFTVAGGTQMLTGINTFSGALTIDSGAVLALSGAGSVAGASGVEANGQFNIAGTTAGATIATLSGNGSVTLGARSLTIDDGSTSFSGVISGSGGLTVAGGTQTLAGTNTLTGTVLVQEDATLALSGGAIASASLVQVDGTLDVSANTSTNITTLSGSGDVALGTAALRITNGSTTFAGDIQGAAGSALTIAGGTQTLSGTNTMAGAVTIDSGAVLALTGTGSIAAASGVAANGGFDISATTAGASITTLSGSGTVALGARTLTTTNGSSTFAGAIGGTGGLTVSGGTQTLSGTNGFTGAATIADGATLALTGTGSIAAASQVQADGSFDISATSAGASITTLTGTGDVALGAQRLTVTNGSTTFAGDIAGTGGLTVSGGTQTLSGANSFTGTAVVNSVAGLSITGTGSVADAARVQADGEFNIAGTSAGSAIRSLSGSGFVVLGAQTLSVTAGGDDFAGNILGTGNLNVSGGTQALSGSNAMTGQVVVADGARLNILGSGSIASASQVEAAGQFDIASATSPVQIRTLTGTGDVTLGAQTLRITAGSTEFGGDVSGTGTLAIGGGTQRLSGSNSLTGLVHVESGATLQLTGTGSIATASEVRSDGVFSLANTSNGASITTLSGGGVVLLGARDLVVTAGSTTFAGGIAGSGGVTITGGTQRLSGQNIFQGPLTIGASGALDLLGTGSVAEASRVDLAGRLDISGTTSGASITTLTGAGVVALGAQTLTVTNASTDFAGTIGGTGGFAVSGGTQMLSGLNTYSGGTRVSNGTLVVASDAALGAASSGVTLQDGRLRFLTDTSSARNFTMGGQGTVDTNTRNITLSGTIGGSGGLVADGGGVLTLTGDNSYAGGTLVIGGTTLAVGKDSALGAPEGAVVIDNGKLLALADFASTRAIQVNTAGEIDANGFVLSLSGPINMQQTGAPDVVLFNGDATVQGPITVDSTGLTVLSNATLRGTGEVFTNTTINGVLAPGQSPGTLTFLAPLTISSSGTLRLDIDGTGTGTGAGNYSRVLLSGSGSSFTAQGGTIVPLLRGISGDASNSYSPPVGQGFNVVQADGGVFGSFASLTQPEGLLAGSRLDALYTDQALTLYVTPSSYTNLNPFGVGLTPNQAQVGLGLDALRPTPGLRTNAETTAVLGTLFSQVPAALPPLMTRLAGTIYGDALMVGIDRSRGFGEVIADQAAARRGLTGQATASGDGRRTAWATGFGGNARFDATGDTGYRNSTSGMAAGADIRLDSGILVGMALGGSSGRISSSATDARVSGEMVHAALYGGWSGESVYIDTQLGLSHAEVNARRNLGLNGLTAHGSASGLGGSAAIETGTRHRFGNWQIQPGIGLRYDALSRDRLTEDGASVLSLAVEDSQASSLRATAGFRAETSIMLGEGYHLRPHLRLHVAQEMGDTETRTTSAFVGAPGAAMVARTADRGRTAGLAGLGAELALPNGLALFAGYSGAVQQNVSNHAGSVGLRFQW
ncbi:autotransporter-associated beta strand repeat-containing protein [Roseomonas sp. F4]